MIQHQRLIISALEKQAHVQSKSYRRVFAQHCLCQGNDIKMWCICIMAYYRSSRLYRVIDIQIDNRLIVKTKFSLKIKQNHQNDIQTIMYFFL